MAYKENDFVEVEFDIYANGKLVQTTDKKKAETEKLQITEFGPQTMILGKAYILKALDEDIIKNGSSNLKTIELEAKDAYGLRNKEMIKVLPKSAFAEHNTRPVPGVVYDFNGIYGTVKSVVGGRVMVDFNNPLSGKDIKIEYKIISKIEDIKTKSAHILETILRIPKNMFSVELNEKKLTLNLPEQIIQLKEMIENSLKDFVPELKEYSIEIQKFKNN